MLLERELGDWLMKEMWAGCKLSKKWSEMNFNAVKGGLSGRTVKGIYDWWSEEKWSEVKWSEVKWSEVKWSEVKVLLKLVCYACGLTIFETRYSTFDRLCGLVVRVSGYRYRGLGFDSRRYQISWVVVGLERGPLSFVRSIEELLE